MNIPAAYQAQPGLVTTIQLGHKGDHNWQPHANCVLIAVEKSYFEKLQFYAAAKMENGETMICLSVEEFDSRDENEGHARFHCTRMIPLDDTERYMSSAETNFIRRAIACHKPAINKLTPFVMMEN